MKTKIISANEHRFKLECSLPIFDNNIIQQIGQYEESEAAQELIHNNVPIETDNESLFTFFRLFCQPNPIIIESEISTE